MANSIAKLTENAKSALRLVKSVGPFLISQSAKASESMAEHQLRLARVESAREFMVTEAKAISDVRANLRARYYEAEPEDRVRLKRDIEESERELRRLHVIYAALEKLPPDDPNEPESETNAEEVQISPHWLDKFNEFAKAQNEPWRRDLLASALAIEAKEPGAIGPRALWLIGTLDEYLFQGFASLLDVSTVLAGGYLIPKHNDFNNRPIPECALGPNKAIGNLIFLLSDLGLFGDVMTSQKQIPEGARVLAQYGHRRVLITTKKKMVVNGVIPTTLGTAIARLYTPRPNLLGQEIFESWCKRLGETEATTQDLA